MIPPNNALSFMGSLVSKQKGILERLLASQPMEMCLPQQPYWMPTFQ